MVASPSLNPQQHEAAPPGLLTHLLGWARAAVFPSDAVLAGMVAAGLCVDALCQFLGLTGDLLYEHVVRLGLRTPNDKAFRAPGARGWSILDTQRLIAWRAIGVHPEVIGETLSRTRSANAVRAKSRRLGLAAPKRSSLFRPFAGDLRDPPEGFAPPEAAASPRSRCGRPAGPLTCPTGSHLEPASVVAAAQRSAGGLARHDGQRELTLPGIVGSADHERPSTAQAPAVVTADDLPEALSPIPATIADVDLADLTWIARLKRPLSHEPAVWAVGMLMMGGLHFRDAAARVGRSASSFRTLRTRMGVPVDLDRKKTSCAFDVEVAHATRERNKYIVRRSLQSEDGRGRPQYFWVHQNDRGMRMPPTHRTRDRHIEGRSPGMTIVTRAILNAEAMLRNGGWMGRQAGAAA